MQGDTPLPDELRDAALRLRVNIETRVDQAQGGVPTFFDAYLADIIDQLTSTEAIHGWSCQSAPVPELQWLKEFLRKRNHDRLVPYQVRRGVNPKDACDIGLFELAMSQGMLACLMWNNRPLFKTVYDYALLPMLVHELKPATIFEIGSGTGASASWMADICAIAKLPTKIYSVDIRRVVHADSAVITFHEGDANNPASLFPVDLLNSAAHPWLVIEDVHVNVLDVLRHFDRFLRNGDYLIVEDSRDKHDALRSFVTDRYRVDSRFTDFFGRNATSAEDSILRVIA